MCGPRFLVTDLLNLLEVTSLTVQEHFRVQATFFSSGARFGFEICAPGVVQDTNAGTDRQRRAPPLCSTAVGF